MKIISNQIHPSRLQTVTASLMLGVLIAVASHPAAADPRQGDRDWRGHEARAHRYWHGPHYVPEPGVVYAPPVVYEPPPPVESPGLNLIIPLNIR